MDHQDLQMAANTFKLNLNVLSVELNEPKWTNLKPDPRLKEHTCAVCKVIANDYEFPKDIYTLHTKNHFELFIPKNSFLAENLGYKVSSPEAPTSPTTEEQNKHIKMMRRNITKN